VWRIAGCRVSPAELERPALGHVGMMSRRVRRRCCGRPSSSGCVRGWRQREAVAAGWTATAAAPRLTGMSLGLRLPSRW
jgi:hypothetical protein